MAPRHIHCDGRKELPRPWSKPFRRPVASLPLLPTLVRILLAVVAASALYALVGFQLLPRVLRYQAIQFVHQQYGRQLQIGQVHLQPFALALELRDVALPDADGQVLIGWQRAYVDFEALASLWQRAYVFEEIGIAGPRLRVVERAGGQLDFAELTDSTRPAPKAVSPASPAHEPPALAIHTLDVLDGVLEVSLRNRPRPYTQAFSPLSFKVRNFRSVHDGQLDAQHHIRVDQLTWGEATETSESVGLPVRLATAMLRDRDGVLSLEIPVQGSLEDPTSRVGSIIVTSENGKIRCALALE
jgi:hypothetical protein